MTNCPFLGEGRETVTAAVANGIDELFNKGSQSLLDHVNCQHCLSLSLDHPYRHKSSLTVEIMSPSLFIYHMSSCHMSPECHPSHVIYHPVGRKEWLQQAWCGTVHRFCFVLSQLIFKVVFFSMHQYYVALSYDWSRAGILRTNGMKLEEGGLSSSPGVVLYPAYCLINHACRWPASPFTFLL